jgi:hypothetical protein
VITSLSLIHTRCNSLQQVLIVLNLLCLYQYPLTSFTPYCIRKTQLNSLKDKVTCILRQAVSRLVRPSVRHSPGTRDPFFPFSLRLFFRQFLVCWSEAPSLTRSRVCSFQFLLGIASAAFLRFESHGTHEHSLSLFLDSCNLEGQVPVFISSRNRVAQLYHWRICLLNSLYTRPAYKNFRTDCIENTFSNGSSIVVSRWYLSALVVNTIPLLLFYRHYLPTAVVLESHYLATTVEHLLISRPLLSNGPICHNTL